MHAWYWPTCRYLSSTLLCNRLKSAYKKLLSTHLQKAPEESGSWRLILIVQWSWIKANVDDHCWTVIKRFRHWHKLANNMSRFSMSGAHAHRVGPLDTSSHATKVKKCANGTGSLMTLNCSKGVNQGVTCTSIFIVLRSFTVENQLAVLSTTRSR